MSASPFPIAFQLEPEGEDERRRRYDPTEPEYWMQLPPETEPVEAIHFLLHIVGSEVPRQQYDPGCGRRCPSPACKDGQRLATSFCG